MKVAIVHDFLIKLGGAERFLECVHSVYPDAPIYTLLYDEKGTRGVFASPEYNIIPSSLQRLPSLIRRRSKLLLSGFPKAIEEIDLSDYDLVISISNSYAHGVITKPSTLHICYCHSPARYLWDWHAEFLEENSIGYGILGIIIRNILSKIRVWDYYAASRPDYWIANSKTVSERLKKYFRVKSEVIYPATNFRIEAAEQKGGDYYLIISRLSPYKKIDLAVEAFNKNRKKLVIIGEGSDLKRLKALAAENISFTGYISEAQLKRKLAGCKALIFPGEEDFGLTPIEAMAAGKPVVAFKKGGVTETIVEGKTGLFFTEPNAKSLIDAVHRLEMNYDNFSSEECISRAKKFSKEAFVMNFSNFIESKYNNFKNEQN